MLNYRNYHPKSECSGPAKRAYAGTIRTYTCSDKTSFPSVSILHKSFSKRDFQEGGQLTLLGGYYGKEFEKLAKFLLQTRKKMEQTLCGGRDSCCKLTVLFRYLYSYCSI